MARLVSAIRDGRIRSGLQRRARDAYWRWRSPRNRVVLRRAVEQCPPLRCDPASPLRLHTIVCHRDADYLRAMLHSVLRFAHEPVSVTVHDDGSLTRDDARALQLQFPDIDIIPRAEADAHVGGVLRKMGLARARAFRREICFALKLYDAVFYAEGRRFAYLDTDILAFRSPEALWANMEPRARDDADLSIAYNLNGRGFYGYAWSPEEIRLHFGIDATSNVNAGLFVARWDAETSWRRIEEWLAAPCAASVRFLREQTFVALEAALRGARPLPEEYDVAFRFKLEGGDPIVEHYTGWRPHYMPLDFASLVAPPAGRPRNRLRRPSGRAATPNAAPPTCGDQWSPEESSATTVA